MFASSVSSPVVSNSFSYFGRELLTPSSFITVETESQRENECMGIFLLVSYTSAAASPCGPIK